MDVFLGISNEYNSSVSAVRDRLNTAYKAATEASKSAAKHQSAGYNTKVRGQSLQEGNYVLVKKVGLGGKQKLADKWQTERYLVVSQPNKDLPVYKVRKENSNKDKVLHRNMLLPLSLPLRDISEPDSDHVQKQLPEPDSVSDFDDSDSELGESFDIEIANVNYDVSDIVQENPVQELISNESTLDEVAMPQDETEEAIDAEDSSSGASVHSDDTEGLGYLVDEQPSTPNVVVPPSPQGAEVEPPPPEDVRGFERGDEEVQPDIQPSGRPKRNVRVPDYLSKNYILNSQRAVVDCWRDKVSVLLNLTDIFPGQKAEICRAILYVIMTG